MTLQTRSATQSCGKGYRPRSKMATAAFDEKKLRGIVKDALVDAFKEHLELMQDIVQEALEDIAMARAIEQGLETKPVSRKKVFSILESGQ